MLIFRTEDTWNRFSRYFNRLDKSRFNLSVNEERKQKEKKECDYHWLLVIHAASNKNGRSRFFFSKSVLEDARHRREASGDSTFLLWSPFIFILAPNLLFDCAGSSSRQKFRLQPEYFLSTYCVKLSEILSYPVWYRHKYYGIWNLYFKTRLKWLLSPVECERILSVTDLRAK